MNKTAVTKSSGCTPEELEKINGYTRRELSEEEVYCFQVVLCDNEIDRDMECFPEESLHTLAGLFLGKTGIFDHDPKGQNQTARIYDTEVVAVPGRKTSYGAGYVCLKARAYMVRSEKYAGLILEIDAGIKKEVSVGCRVGEVCCSVCGADLRKKQCGHIRGQEYNGVPCYALLKHPADAYEWSFVAVPAQRDAGVTKRYGSGRGSGYPSTGVRSAKALVRQLKDCPPDGISLSPEEAAGLSQCIGVLAEGAKRGTEYTELLRERVKRWSLLKHSEVEPEAVAAVVARMSHRELLAFDRAYREDYSGAQIAVKGISPVSGEAGGSEAGNRVFQV